jgi:hypothetical protein
MRRSAFIAFFGVATAISGSLIGCSDDDDDEDEAKPVDVTKSAENESCVRTDDCESGLKCVNNVCVESAGSTGGSGGSGPITSPLGDVGETCSRSADCKAELGCFNGRCAEEPAGEGGSGNMPPVTLGKRGETCVVSSDCEAGLVCRPGGMQTSIGVCTETDTDIVPTGNVCGAECKTAEDCCELPVELQASLDVKSCVELDDLLVGVDCETTAVVTEQQRCFAQTAYCECAADTWECSQGSCLYIATCSADGLVPGGCATVSRSGRNLFSTCDVADTELCQPSTVDPLCVEDDDCEAIAVSDDPSDTCVADECTCFQGGCYRRCSEDLDCRASRQCDAGASVCVPVDGCASDLNCQVTMGDVRAECVNGQCTLPCEIDLDCNALTGGTFQRVCHQGMCQALGCANDDECPGAASGVRLFCTPATDAPGGTSAESAITE